MPNLEQLNRQLVHDPCRVGDREPLGAVAAGTCVTVTLRVAGEVRGSVRGAVLEVCEMPADASQEPDIRAVEMWPCERGFAAEIDTSGAPRVLYYRFRMRMEDREYLCACGAGSTSTTGVIVEADASSVAQAGSPGFQLTVYDPSFEVPSWFQGGIMYQVFPDRFARGSDGVRISGVQAHREKGWPVHLNESWDETPAWNGEYDPFEFFGGTLAGIAEKLDYLQSLGVTVLYLNPICEARSNHRYDTGDYEKVDAILGDNEDLNHLIETAREHGIRVILDTVLAHTGSESRYFNGSGSYGTGGAAQSEASPYRDWYDFDPAGDVPYRSWWNDPSLPRVNTENESWQEYISGVLEQWISAGVRGLRLDVADEIPDSALEVIRRVAKCADSESVIVGEVWEDATSKVSYGKRRTYALGNALDSVMNYPLRDALLEFAINDKPATQLATFLKIQESNYPRPLYHSLMNLLSTHDVERVRTVLSLGRQIRHETRENQAALMSSVTSELDEKGASLQRVLATLLYVLPGVPCLYYGDECGMQGGSDPFCRATFPKNADSRSDCGLGLTEFFRRLGAMRRRSAAFSDGDAGFFTGGPDVLGIVRMDPGNNRSLLCVANRGKQPARFVFDFSDLASGLSSESIAVLRKTSSDVRLIFAASDDRCPAGTSLEDGIFISSIPPEDSLVFEFDIDGGKFCASSAPKVERPVEDEKPVFSREIDYGKIGKKLEPGMGIVCHVTSIPNKTADGGDAEPGNLGKCAFRFIDHLADVGTRYWQVLPLNPTDEYGSPYAGLSAFAGNTFLIDDESADCTEAEVDDFIVNHADWLLPYATFTAIKECVDNGPWQGWPEKYRTWKPGMESDPLLADAVRRECARQCTFGHQWDALRAYANSHGIGIIGDMPFYVSADSADVWAHPEYFDLDEEGFTKSEGGCPPDQFAEDGQAWGVPTYRWDVLHDSGYDWWLQRLSRSFELYDFTRLDHFLGFSRYFSIPAGEKASTGVYLEGPGYDLFARAHDKLGSLPLIAEDLGIITPESEALLERCGFPGLDVVQFEDGDPVACWAPRPGKLCYTSTHDTQTLVGWVLDRYCGGKGSGDLEAAKNVARELASRMLSSSERVIMLTLQDSLLLDDSARMNVPGTTDGRNWNWQAREEDLNRLSYMHAAFRTL